MTRLYTKLTLLNKTVCEWGFPWRLWISTNGLQLFGWGFRKGWEGEFGEHWHRGQRSSKDRGVLIEQLAWWAQRGTTLFRWRTLQSSWQVAPIFITWKRIQKGGSILLDIYIYTYTHKTIGVKMRKHCFAVFVGVCLCTTCMSLLIYTLDYTWLKKCKKVDTIFENQIIYYNGGNCKIQLQNWNS